MRTYGVFVSAILIIGALALGIAVGSKVQASIDKQTYGAAIDAGRARIDMIAEQLDGAMFRLQQYAARTTFSALASWYGPGFHGRTAADGSTYDQHGLTVAHPDLPLGTILWITNTANGKAVYARVSDRGPWISGRSLDVSFRVAEYLGMVRDGLAVVRCRVLDVEPRPRPGDGD